MSITQLLLILRSRWLSGLLVLSLVMAAIGGFTYTATPQYTASATVVLDVKSPDPIAGMVLPGMTVSSYMGTQIDVVRSERVAMRAIRALKIDENEQMHAQWMAATGGQGDFLPWVAELILNNLEVRPSRDSNVITISYESADPTFAAAMANAFVKGYIDTTLELRVQPAKEYNAFFDDRAKQVRLDLEAAQNRLSEYQRVNGILASDERMDIENERLSELSTQLVTMQTLADESRSRSTQVRANADRMEEVLQNPIVTSLTTDLAREERRLAELSLRLGDQNPQVIELRGNIAELRGRIASETRRVSGSVAVTDSVNQDRVAKVRAALQEQRDKVLKMKSQRDEMAVLMRDIENAQRSYDAVLARLDQTHLESQTSQTNVSILKPAAVPAFPSSPRTRLNLSIGLTLGLLLAIGFMLAREFADPRLRTDEDVLQRLGAPMLGFLPERARLGSGIGATGGRLLAASKLRGLPSPRAKWAAATSKAHRAGTTS